MQRSLRFLLAGCCLLAASSLLSLPPTAVSVAATDQPQVVGTAGRANRRAFVIVMENHNWADIKDSPSAPYINKTLLPMGAHAEQYYNPQGLHPSEPNYLWLEAGTNFNILHDEIPKIDHQASTDHLVSYLGKAGLTWKSYQEGIDGKNCPLVGRGLYAPTHNPMVYFDDVTDSNKSTSANCIAHIRPYTELYRDLFNNTVANYNFITPDLCHDMHNNKNCDSADSIKNGDDWLASALPMLLGSQAYKDGGLIFIAWDEAEEDDGPIGLIVLGKNVKVNYANKIRYTHSSTLRTLQEIFELTPWLGDAAKANDLSDLFTVFP